MGRVMAIDIGASSYRVIEGIYSDGNLSMKTLARFRHTPIWKEGHYRLNIYEMRDNLVEALQSAAKSGEPIKSVGIDTFGTDFGLLDNEGRLLEEPLAYRDSISDGISARFFTDTYGLYGKVGGTFETTSTAHILKGMKESGMDALERADRLLFMPDLFAYLFTGQPTNEFTIATTSRLIDAEKREWNRELIRELQLPEKIFYPLQEAGTVIGYLKKDIRNNLTNLEQTKVVMTACHDTASAVLTVPEKSGCSFISSGTWSVKGIVSRKPYVSRKACDQQMSNEGQPWGRYRLIRNITGLWLLEECVRDWKKKGKQIEIPLLVEEAQNSPLFPSIIFPDGREFSKQGEMVEKICGYCSATGQEVPSTPVEIAQTILQGLACEYRRHNEQLRQVTGKEIKQIYIVGGGRNNRFLNPCTADVTGCQVIAGNPEATAAGNILVQLWAAGEIEDPAIFPEIAAGDTKTEMYVPSETEKWEERFDFYCQLAEREKMV